MKKKVLSRSAVLTLVMVLVVLPFITCAPAPSPVEPVAAEKVVKIGVLSDLTGPYSSMSIGGGEHDGYMEHCKMVNENGGINGVKIDPLWADHQANAALAVAAYKRIKSAGAVVFNCMTSVEGMALKAMLEADKIPMIGTSSAIGVYIPPAWSYCVMNSGHTYAGALKWFYEDVYQPKDLGRPMKVATIAWNNAWGHEAVRAAKSYIDRNPDVELVVELYPATMALDYTSELMVAVEEKVDVVYSFGIGGFGLPAMARDAAKVGLPEDVKILMEGGVQTAAFVKMAGAEMDTYVRGSYIYGLLGEENEKPGVKLMYDTFRKYQGREPDNAYYVVGWAPALVTVEAVSRALDEVGYDNLTSQAVKDAIDSIDGWETGGVIPTVSFKDSANDRQAVEMTRMVKHDFAGKKDIALTDYISCPWDYFFPPED